MSSNWCCNYNTVAGCRSRLPTVAAASAVRLDGAAPSAPDRMHMFAGEVPVYWQATPRGALRRLPLPRLRRLLEHKPGEGGSRGAGAERTSRAGGRSAAARPAVAAWPRGRRASTSVTLAGDGGRAVPRLRARAASSRGGDRIARPPVAARRRARARAGRRRSPRGRTATARVSQDSPARRPAEWLHPTARARS